MAQSEGYIRWPTDAKIPLSLSIADSLGRGVVGATPQVAIRRYRETHGAALDNYFWNGTTFIPTPFYFMLEPLDAINAPGEYGYVFEQDLVGLETIYRMHYRNLTDPIGFATELHVITNEVYVPDTQPDPITFGPSTVMGQLELIKDGGTGQFVAAQDSLHVHSANMLRVLGLLHYNAMVDKQRYDSLGQLTSGRLRVYDTPAHVPASPDGNETTGLLQEYAIEAAYEGAGILKKYSLKKVL